MVSLILFGSFFVWDVEIEGNETVSDERILRALEAEGVTYGTFGLGIHPETAFSLGNCGAALAGDAQWEKAAQTLEEALSCYESLGLSDSPEAVTCRNNLNLCRNAVKQSAAQ